MDMQQEKVAIVTGGGSGIGKYSALALLEKGYSVTIAGRRETKLNDVLETSLKIVMYLMLLFGLL